MLPNELLPAVIVLFAVSGGLFVLGYRLARWAPRVVMIAVGGTLAGLVWAATFGQDRLLWACLLPWADGAVVFGNATLPLFALLAGLVVPRLPRRRAAVLLGIALLFSLFQSLRPLCGTPPAIGPTRLKDGVVMQTDDASCSAASAATLLRYHGIAATEAEMGSLCLTRADGTAMLGVYRGLKKKTVGTDWRVSVLTGTRIDDLRRATADGPVLLSVGIDRWQRGIDPRYERDWGWTPGKRHAVVLLGFLPEGRISVADPAVGREVWREEALSVLWHGEGVRLVKTDL